MISACILTKNDAGFIDRVIHSVSPFVSEIIVVDDKSTDNTKAIALSLGAIVYDLPLVLEEVGFGVAANWMLDKVTQEWILIIDSDELLAEGPSLINLTRNKEKEIWALPRRKWASFKKGQRCEYEAYPDWQIRFLRNTQDNRFEGQMHVRLNKKSFRAYRGPHIEHLQDECRTQEKSIERENLYKKLATKQGVAVIGGLLLEKL